MVQDNNFTSFYFSAGYQDGDLHNLSLDYDVNCVVPSQNSGLESSVHIRNTRTGQYEPQPNIARSPIESILFTKCRQGYTRSNKNITWHKCISGGVWEPLVEDCYSEIGNTQCKQANYEIGYSNFLFNSAAEF